MVLYICKWDIRPEKTSDYPTWAKSAIQRIFAVPGVLEFRGYRPASGSHEVAVTYEFKDMNSWATWMSNDDVKKVWAEAHLYCENMYSELWGPSPVTPKPIHSGK
ncbi:MAG: antibiotic biosynthesis monooxygenase [Candidatus Latescibacteria bacterium]|nr:antibiotic biosynthesis monooxygenase [Candidatus Latescibacterota bacterium]